ncbi:uncharacterized protein V1518DRAFT_192475 [Limtongia smithiae]|uniref:uncharacterized protein n=1 Tax=Limtongia smithiae TaxID=1125753 RepID=UPI0034CD19FD
MSSSRAAPSTTPADIQTDANSTTAAGFDVFMSGIALHFRPLKYAQLRSWVVARLGDMYAGLQTAAGEVSAEVLQAYANSMNPADFVGAPEVVQVAVSDASDTISDVSAAGSAVGGELSYVVNTVSGLYRYLSPTDDEEDEAEGEQQEGNESSGVTLETVSIGLDPRGFVPAAEVSDGDAHSEQVGEASDNDDGYEDVLAVSDDEDSSWDMVSEHEADDANE